MNPLGDQALADRRDGRTASVDRILGRVTWAVIAGSVVVNEVVWRLGHATERVDPSVLVGAQGVFFVLLVLRLGWALHRGRDRRRARFAALAGVVLWSIAAVSVAAAPAAAFRRFPGPGEWLFLAAYVGFAGYLLLDVEWRRQRALARWLEVAVTCGGVSCVSAILLVAPVQTASGAEGLPLFLGLLYPMLDLGLAIVVAGQQVLRVRPDGRAAAALIAGFAALAVADSAFTLQVSADRYEFGPVSDVLWGVSFALIVGSACRPRSQVLSAAAGARSPRGTTWMVLAAVVAMVVLTFHPGGAADIYILPPALLTLVAAGARMVVAMREANRAAEAFALSQTDDLTRLPNRRAVRERLRADIAAHKPLALMLLDLDGFKEVNDTLGHHAGDTVLQVVAVRLLHAAGPTAMVARLGGDEFAVILASTDEIELLETARRMLDDLVTPVVVDGIEICPSGSIGIAVGDMADTAEGDLLRRADVAMYQAKAARSGAALYDAHFDDFSRPRLQLAEELRRAITDGQIQVWYQPQVDIVTRRVRSVEALVRWVHPTEGVRSPAFFLPAARRAGLMGALSELVARTAVEQLRDWLADGLDLQVSINCAPPELLSHTFLPRLYGAMRDAGVPGDRLVLEVTEDSFLADPSHAREILQEVRSRGIQVAIDDYGTGFSSLAYLRDLPVQELKIDRSFVQAAATDERSRMIVASTVQLGHALDMRIVAEGAEDAETFDVLVELGVDSVQGYHLARPQPAFGIAEWVHDWHTAAALFAETSEFDTTPSDERERRPSENRRESRVHGGRRARPPHLGDPEG